MEGFNFMAKQKSRNRLKEAQAYFRATEAV